MTTKSISEIARSIRSKNAGAFFIALEILFDSEDAYRRVKESVAITRAAITESYGVSTDEIVSLVFYDPEFGIKAYFRRHRPSGGPGETDVYGSQQYPSTLSLQVPSE